MDEGVGKAKFGDDWYIRNRPPTPETKETNRGLQQNR
jgi:hypothetical protein